MATTLTLGQPKVMVMRDRLLAINPNAEVVARQEAFSADTAESFALEEYDVVIDAIDSLADKTELILRATTLPVMFLSSMGAALKCDPTKVRMTEFWKVDGCPLARALRKRMRKQGRFPKRKFLCVWSPEVLVHRGSSKEQANGTLMHITALYGLLLASKVINEFSKVLAETNRKKM